MNKNGLPIGKQVSHPFNKRNVGFTFLGLFLLMVSIRSTLPLGNVLISFLAVLSFLAAIPLSKINRHYGIIVLCVLYGFWCVLGYPKIPYDEWLTDYEKSVSAVQNLYVFYFLAAFIGVFTAKKKKEKSEAESKRGQEVVSEKVNATVPHSKDEKTLPNFWMAHYAHLRTGSHAQCVYEMQEKKAALVILVIVFGWITKVLIEDALAIPKEISIKHGLITIPAEYTPYVFGVFATLFGVVCFLGVVGIVLSLMVDSKREVTIKLDRIMFFLPLTGKNREVKFSTVTDMKLISQGSNKNIELTYYDEVKQKSRKCGMSRAMFKNKAEFDDVIIPLLFKLVGQDLEKVKERIKVNQSFPKNRLDFMDKIILALAALFIVVGLVGVVTGDTLMINFKDIMTSKFNNSPSSLLFATSYMVVGFGGLILPLFSYKNWNINVGYAINVVIWIVWGMLLPVIFS